MVNDFLPLGQGIGANVESQADYSVDTARTQGQQPGVASSAFNNKALRQATWIAAVLAQFISNTSGSSVLDDGNQSNLLAAMALTWPSSTVPTQTVFTLTGSATGYLFTVSSANATVGAVYANNGHNYTVLSTISSGTLLFCSQASAPLASGTLTKQSGTGDSTITFSSNQALATYTTPANVKYLKLKMVGGGGGGSGATSGSPNTGVAGLYTVFGSALLIAGGGQGGFTQAASSASIGGAGGTAVINSGATGLALVGGFGGGSSDAGDQAGGDGAGSAFGGGGGSGSWSTNGNPAATNTGGGGGGGGGNNVATGCGGGSGGYIDALISSSIAGTYFYAVGVGGAGGGGNNSTGGDGAAGVILVEEHYNA